MYHKVYSPEAKDTAVKNARENVRDSEGTLSQCHIEEGENSPLWLHGVKM